MLSFSKYFTNSDTTRLWKVPDVFRNFGISLGPMQFAACLGERYQSSRLPESTEIAAGIPGHNMNEQQEQY